MRSPAAEELKGGVSGLELSRSENYTWSVFPAYFRRGVAWLRGVNYKPHNDHGAISPIPKCALYAGYQTQPIHEGISVSFVKKSVITTHCKMSSADAGSIQAENAWETRSIQLSL